MSATPSLCRRVCLLVALAFLSGCDSSPVRHPKRTQVCVLSPDHEAQDVVLEPETAIQIVLPGPDAGVDLIWEIASNDNRILEQMGPLRTAAAPGSGATTEVSFYALKHGRSVLRFVLVRPGVQEAVPAALCKVTVRVQE